MASATLSIGPYQLKVGPHYDPEGHFWIAAQGEALHRIGFDPLGAETSGDIVAISIAPVGTHVERGGAFGSLEAAKFVGPLISPVSGVIRSHNPSVVMDPSLVNARPLEAWLMEVELDNFAAEKELLLSDPAELGSWLKREIERFKEKGMVAE